MVWLSGRKFGLALGVSNTQVKSYIDAGRITSDALRTNAKGWIEIDLERGKRDLAKNLDPAGRMAIKLNAKGEQAELTPEQESLVDDEDALAPVNSDFARHRAEREAWASRNERLKFEKDSGKLVDVSSVRKEAYSLARQIRDLMRNIPDRVSSELAAELDADKIHARLLKEIDLCLRSIPREGAELPLDD